ncbi:MAG: class I SAM-dependent methyltransferase, partial [Gammaproteobacteria bacterium]
MAVLWEKRSGGRHYEVRGAGATRRLYTDGVFHSQFSPRRPLTGSIWDLLLLPAYFHDPSDIRRVLVLGVGGGTVIRQFQHFIAPECIEGVELNPVHLTVAR